MAAELVGVNRNTATLFYHRMRELIAQRLSTENPSPETPVVEDVTPDAAAAPHARAALSKVPVFALVRRGDRVLTVMAPDATHRELDPDSIVYAEGSAGPVDVASLRHERVQRRAHQARGRAPISSTENFWSQAKRQLRRYNGVPRQHFHLFLKECEWRYNYGPPKQLLKLLKSWLRRQAHAR